MPRKNHKLQEQIFQQNQDSSPLQPSQKPQSKSLIKNISPNSDSDQEEGQIREESSQNDDNQPRDQINEQAGLINQQVYDSSEEDNQRLEQQKKKRQQFWKHMNQPAQKIILSEADLLQKAFETIQKTNKRIMILRKKNQKRMEDLQKIRMAQQPYLTTGNTHFRGSSSQYSIITFDSTGKSFYHPNNSLRIGEMKLQNFIQKNIKEETTANYLNQVVKFQNYAYQQRKKRRHNIQ